MGNYVDLFPPYIIHYDGSINSSTGKLINLKDSGTYDGTFGNYNANQIVTNKFGIKKGLQFNNGVNNQSANTPAFLDGVSEITLFYLFRIDTITTSRLFAWNNGTPAGYVVWWDATSPNVGVQYWVRNGSNGSITGIQVDSIALHGSWATLAVTYKNGTTAYSKLYINGNLIGSQAHSAAGTLGTIGTINTIGDATNNYYPKITFGTMIAFSSELSTDNIRKLHELFMRRIINDPYDLRIYHK